VRREREARGRVRFLSDDERERLLEACKRSPSPNLYVAVILTLSTGMRHSEVRYLTWSQVDLARGVIILSETKNKECRRVSVRGLALDLLRQHAKVRRLDNNHVFPGEQNAKVGGAFHLDRFWYPALRASGIENFRFHDLRHCCASYLAMNGASLLEIAEVLGHKTLQMVRRYSHLAESHTAMVVESMNRKIFGV
jgi:integrase